MEVGPDAAVVGHEPWLSQLVAWLTTGEQRGELVELEKGGDDFDPVESTDSWNQSDDRHGASSGAVESVVTSRFGHSRVNPSEGHFRVASMPILPPNAG